MNRNDMFFPNYEAATGLLKHLNSEELKELLNDDAKLNNVIKDLQQVKNIELEKEMMMASNKSLAEYNLSLKPTLEENRLNLVELYSKATELKDDIAVKKDKLEKKQPCASLSTTLAVLQAKTAEVEEESEMHIEKLLDGQINVEEFLSLFLAARTNVHILRTKADKMKAIVTNQSQLAVKPVKPVRTRKAPLPPVSSPENSKTNSYMPPPMFGRIPVNPVSMPSPVLPPNPMSNGMNNPYYPGGDPSNYRPPVPTRVAPMPPNSYPSHIPVNAYPSQRSPYPVQMPPNSINQMQSAFNSFGINSSQNFPVGAPMYPKPSVIVPKRI